MNYKSTSVLDIITELANESGKNAKVDILEKYKNHPNLKAVLHAAYNPFLTYYIKDIPDYNQETRFEGIGLHRAIEQLELFANRKLTGHKALNKLVGILESLHKDDAEIYCRIIKKDLRAGFSATTINKVWAGLIPKHCYMGAVPYDEKLFNRFPFESGGVVSQVKEDGMFASYDFAGDEVKPCAFTRKGRKLNFNGQFDEWLGIATQYLAKKYPQLCNIGQRFDGEILVLKDGVDPNSSDYEDRSVSNGIANKASGKGLPIKESRRLRYVVWDLVNIVDAYKGLSNVPYKTRFNILREVVDYTNNVFGIKLVRIVETLLCKNKEQAIEHFKRTVRRGLEGTIIKHSDHSWKDGKPNTQMKLKIFVETELKIVGFNESDKNPNTLGSFQCQTDCGELSVNVGSGFSKEQVKSFWENRDNFLNKIVTVQYCEITENRDGGNSLANPVFIDVRIDKNNANTFEELVTEYESVIGVKATVSGGKS